MKDFMLLLQIQKLQVDYLIGVTVLHVIDVDFRAPITRSSLSSFSDSRKKTQT